jgi:hypothetical protein
MTKRRAEGAPLCHLGLANAVPFCRMFAPEIPKLIQSRKAERFGGGENKSFYRVRRSAFWLDVHYRSRPVADVGKCPLTEHAL